MRKIGFSFWRKLTQIAGLILPNAFISGWVSKPHLYSGVLKSVPFPTLNCYACPGAFFSCPIGSLQHFVVIKTVPQFVLATLVFVSASVGRLFCGWLCPFGFIQDLLFKIPLPKIRLPRFFRWLKYVVLILTVFLLPLIIADTVFCKLCPQGALEGGIPQVLLNKELRSLLGTLFAVKIVILIAVIILAILITRIFCRAICPLGAFFALFNRVSALRLVVDMNKCVKCGKCRKVCPVDIEVFDDPNSAECIRCGLCIEECSPKAVRFTTIFGKQAEVANEA